MRRSRGTNIFSLIGKGLFESNVGRIKWRSNMWAIVGGEFDKRRIRNTSAIGIKDVNDKGEFVTGNRVLVKKPYTLCPNAPVPQERFFFDEKRDAPSSLMSGQKNRYWWVPRTVCVTCQFHAASSREFRFPRCKFRAADTAAAAAKTLVQISETVKKASEEVDRMMGK